MMSNVLVTETVETLRQYMELIESLMESKKPLWYRGGRVSHDLAPTLSSPGGAGCRRVAASREEDPSALPRARGSLRDGSTGRHVGATFPDATLRSTD